MFYFHHCILIIFTILLSHMLIPVAADNHKKRYSCRGYPNPPCDTATTEDDCIAIVACAWVENSDDDANNGDAPFCEYEGNDCGYYSSSLDSQEACEAIGCTWNEYWTQRRLIFTIIVSVAIFITLCSCLLCAVTDAK